MTETVKIIGPKGKVVAIGAKAWAKSKTLRQEGWSEYHEPERKTFAPLERKAEVREPMGSPIEEPVVRRGRPAGSKNTKSDAGKA